MKKFSLEEYLKNPDRKVVTKSGDEVTIIYTKANKEWPVVALINSSIDTGFVWQFSADGESMPDNDGSVYYGGIFFADEEEELTEFETAVGKAMFPGFFPQDSFPLMNKSVKEKAAELLYIAFTECKEREALHMIGEAKEEGRLEVLRYLPKWKKCAKESRLGFSLGLGHDDDGNRIIFYKGYEVLLDELFDKLPKQE